MRRDARLAPLALACGALLSAASRCRRPRSAPRGPRVWLRVDCDFLTERARFSYIADGMRWTTHRYLRIEPDGRVSSDSRGAEPDPDDGTALRWRVVPTAR